jgi:hypothetical protein
MIKMAAYFSASAREDLFGIVRASFHIHGGMPALVFVPFETG